MAAEKRKLKIKTGIVANVSGKDTIKVLVKSRRLHKIYKKIINFTQSFLVHDDGNKAELGDKVDISECKPISRMKRWRLVKIQKKAKTIEAKQKQK